MLRSTSNTSLCFHPERTGIILYFLVKNSYSPPGDRRHSQPHYSLEYDFLNKMLYGDQLKIILSKTMTGLLKRTFPFLFFACNVLSEHQKSQYFHPSKCDRQLNI